MVMERLKQNSSHRNEIFVEYDTKNKEIKIQNKEIRTKLKLNKLQEDLQDKGIKLYGHIKRMEIERLPRNRPARTIYFK